MTSVKPLEYVPMSLRRAVRRNGRKALVEGVLATRQIRGERTLPDYVIVGAQRCGTTSLFRALVNHRGVMANVLGAKGCLLYTSPSPRDATLSRMPSSA